MVKGKAIKADAGIEDAVHVLAFVVPCDAVSDEDYMSKLLELKEYARVRGKRLHFLNKKRQFSTMLIPEFVCVQQDRLFDIECLKSRSCLLQMRPQFSACAENP